ncbi:MAG: hemolysin family protein [Chloroflexi bacterium]|nr:hemolysin family protein [Chloroflexota bacterium]
MIVWNIILILVLIGLNAFFVSVEFSVVASRRSRLDSLGESETRSLSIVRGWLENPAKRNRLIAAVQLGITMIGLMLGAIGENTVAQILEPVFRALQIPLASKFVYTLLSFLPLLISLALVTGMTVIFGEQVPKVATLHNPERFALFAAPIMQVFNAIFKWFIDILDWTTRQVLSMVGLQAANQVSSVYSVSEIKQFVSGPEMEGVLEQPERDMLSAVVDFGSLVVRQVSLPRTEIQAVEADTPLNELVKIATQSNVTKFPVFEDNLDQILGILHVRDILAAMQDPGRKNKTARSLAREALFVPETISVNDLLNEFRLRRQHIAIVLDEYGGTAGLVTLEDLIEEIVGEFRGPFESGPPSIQTFPDGSAMINGLTPIEDINQYFGLHLYDPNYDTIAGYVLGKLGRIPALGDMVESPEDGVALKVEAMDGLRVSQLRLHHLKA